MTSLFHNISEKPIIIHIQSFATVWSVSNFVKQFQVKCKCLLGSTYPISISSAPEQGDADAADATQANNTGNDDSDNQNPVGGRLAELWPRDGHTHRVLGNWEMSGGKICKMCQFNSPFNLYSSVW